MIRLPSGVLTVIFRDDGPLIHAGDCPAYRSVRIQLTEEQRQQLAMRRAHSMGDNTYYEEISRAILEPEEISRAILEPEEVPGDE